ncbi:MAG: hypothetical protein KKA16_04095 [Alphaproteobacteria bacterium]|nr:hypothetical protein [Alphaproteobacteria bacterium]MBU2378368.1 hypothetical protein [Alphaproteobacteria bacterium]
MSDIAASIDLPDGDRLVLFGFSGSGADRGAIARLHSSGRRRWTAPPPAGEAQDAWVAMSLEDGRLVADSFQGLRATLDLDNGAVRDRVFVK